MTDISYIPGSIAGFRLDVPGSRPKEDARTWEVYAAELREGDSSTWTDSSTSIS